MVRFRKKKSITAIAAILFLLFVSWKLTGNEASEMDDDTEDETLQSSNDIYYSTSDVAVNETQLVVDASGNYEYQVLANVGQGWREPGITQTVICLATHSTVDKLFWILEQANMWDGIMSIAVFVPGNELWIANSMISFMRNCSRNIKQKGTFHFAHPINNSVTNEDVPYFNAFSKYSCSEAQKLNKDIHDLLNKTESDRVIYPQNLMRNIARNACPSTFTLSVDVDMIARKHMSRDLTKFLSEIPICEKCGLIVPVYEISDSAKFPPVDKKTLLKLVAKEDARFFHKAKYSRNQGNSKLLKWQNLPKINTSKITIGYQVKTYQEYWEPILILHSSAPGFDERFVGYGFTRNSHILLLRFEKYNFFVLENAFLSHRGFTAKNVKIPRFRMKEAATNRIVYEKLRRALLQKHQMNDIKLLNKEQ